MPRYRDITPAEMTPAQRRVHDLRWAGVISAGVISRR